MKKNNIIRVVIAILVVLLISIGSTYAYFSANITGSESSSTISVGGGTLTLTVNGGSNITVSNIYPSSDAVASKTITLTGTNTTSVIMPYTIQLVIDSNTFSTGSIKYTLTSTNTGSNGNIIPTISTQTNIVTEASNISLGSGNFANGSNKVHTYLLNLYFPDSESNQNSEQGKTITAHIEVFADETGEPDGWSSASEGSLLYALKTNNPVSAPQTVPGQQINNATEAVLSSTQDDYGISYYFRGAVENNYIIFANMCWRIVRVTGDGSIKVVLYNYNPSSVGNPCDTSQDGDFYAFARYSGSTYTTTFNSSANQNAYIGFMYGTPGSASYAAEHANTNKSTILINLETWYTSKLISYSAYLADTIWCNDKSLSTASAYLGYGANSSVYKPYQRLYLASSANPSLICPNDETAGKLSKFTISDTTNGNAI